MKAFLLTVSNLSQLLQRSALTNYCIDLLVTKLFGTSPEKLTSATYPIYHQKTSTVSCPIALNSLQTLICIGRDTCCFKSGVVANYPTLWPLDWIVGLLGSISLFLDYSSSRNQVIKLKFSRPRHQVKNQEPSLRAQIKSEKRPMSPISAKPTLTDPPKRG